MPIERPMLTARWTELLMLNFAVPPDAVARLAPPGTEPDLHDGEAYVSVIGFLFRDARFLGVRFPGHSLFPEVNLRYYVRRRGTRMDWSVSGEGDGQVRRGVVFVREIAPRPVVAAVARWVYNESYVTRPMRSEHQIAGLNLAAGDRVDYAWQTDRWTMRRRPQPAWNRLAARVAAAPRLPAPGSLEEFIVEHYWAYARDRDGATREYRVAHRPWRIAPTADVIWNCDVAATYDNTPLARYLRQPPVMALIADGSPVQVFRGRRIESGRPTQPRAPASDPTAFAGKNSPLLANYSGITADQAVPSKVDW